MAFVTGSVIYGEPQEGSDIDLVVLCDEDSAKGLMHYCDEPKCWDDYCGIDDGEGVTASIRFGCLNIILHTSERKYQAWKDGTEELKGQRPVTREQAVECIKKYLSTPPVKESSKDG